MCIEIKTDAGGIKIQDLPAKNNQPLFYLCNISKVMTKPSYINRLMEVLPEEFRLTYQAKSGDTTAFVKLYDIYVERIYRYIYFLAPNTRAAEVLTLQVFFKAWEQLDRYQIFGSSFIVWLYSVAQNQVNAYFRTYKKTVASDNDFTLAVRGGDFREEFQTIRNGLRLLTIEQQQVLILKFMSGMSNKNIGRVIARDTGDVRVLKMYGLQVLAEYTKKTKLQLGIKGLQRIFEGCLMRLSNGTSTLDESLARYPEFSIQLAPLLETALLLNIGRDVSPLSRFKEYIHDALTQYVWSHPRQQRIVMPIVGRTALTFAMLAATFLVTGTAQAQSALPGEPFYPWKRVSEQAWRALSPNLVATDIVLAERRLNEWVAVARDPVHNANAKMDYLKVLARLESENDVETLTSIVPALQLQQQTLNDAGLPASELNDYLIDIADILLVDVSIQSTPSEVEPAKTLTATPTYTAPTETLTATPTYTAPTETEVSTEIVPTETEVPTEIVPTETEIPTEVVPTVVPTFTPETTPTEGIP